MKTYARLQDGVVAELLTTEHAIHTLFHPDLTWLDVSNEPTVAPGWRSDGRNVSRPPEPPATPETAAPPLDRDALIEALRRDLDALQERLRQLA